MSLVDKVVKRMIITSFFGDGWGDRETFSKLLELRAAYQNRSLLHRNNYGTSDLVVEPMKSRSRHVVSWEGRFTSPLAPTGILPPESRTCRFHLHLPVDHGPSTRVCLLFAPTGDHSFWRRYRFLSYPLAREYGIGSVVVENPFYGQRKPPGQTRSGIRHVSDLFTMGSALILEGGFLFNWLQDEHGTTSLGISGVSLGGHNASLTAAVYGRPLATVPCLSWSTAAHTFSEGIISASCMWSVLQDQLSPGRVAEIREIVRVTDREIAELLDAAREEDQEGSQSTPPLSAASPERTNLVSKILHSERLHSLTNSLTSRSLLSRASSRPDRTTSLYLRLLVDEFSNLKNYPVLACPGAAVVVVADEDLYITRPADDVMIKDISEIWPGSEVRVVKGGHITSYLTHNASFRTAINDAFDRLEGCTPAAKPDGSGSN